MSESPPRFKSAVATLTELSKATGTDKGDAKTCLEEAGIMPEVKGAGHFYPAPASIRALSDRKGRLSIQDELNRERAAHERVKRLILEDEYRPVAELREATAELGQLVTRLIEDSDLSADEQEKFANALASLEGRYSDSDE